MDLVLKSGEIHAALGENGAGKSTLIKMLSGSLLPDDGSVYLESEPVRFSSPRDALRAGISTIYQEVASFEGLTVAEQISVGKWPTKRGLLSARAMHESAREVLSELAPALKTSQLMSSLSLADRQLVEICAAVARGTRVLIMDEATASLSAHEANRLYELARKMADRGCAVAMITHRFEEVMSHADTYTVLRDGRLIETGQITDTSEAQLIELMAGVEVETSVSPDRNLGPTLISVEGLSREEEYENISFEVREGEIVGLAGLVGAGRTEIGETIAGWRAADAGAVICDGTELKNGSRNAAARAGVSYLPEDRARHGLVLAASVSTNLTVEVLGKISWWGLIQRRIERAIAKRRMQLLSISARTPSQRTSELSGGNQQKVAIGRRLESMPRVLILDEPTRGVDIRKKHEIHDIVRDLASGGAAIVIISSDFPELALLSDRVEVIFRGKQVAKFSAPVDASALLDTAMRGGAS
ncbi:MAG: sugar ABC transporter ATP-binding protein [Microcella sp.]|uniref:sugar ABC transporter ATP-binding protein n=1 Tax=Microcella sp. TaxID=1913979 RepID=UPI00331521C5